MFVSSREISQIICLFLLLFSCSFCVFLVSEILIKILTQELLKLLNLETKSYSGVKKNMAIDYMKYTVEIRW